MKLFVLDFVRLLYQGYVLLSLRMKGEMPWSVAHSHEECLRMKRECDVMQLADSLDCREVNF